MTDDALDVRGGVSRVSVAGLAAGGVVHVTAGYPQLEHELQVYPMRVHDDAARDVISAELVACTLGARVRPELQMPWPDAVHDRLAVLKARLRRIGVPRHRVSDAVKRFANTMMTTP